MDPSFPRDPLSPSAGGGASSAEETDPGLAETHHVQPPPPAARRYHHYEVCLRDDGVTLHELGRGAMGISYKARDVNLDVPVAIKVISAGLPGEIQARERFRREARAAAQLHHPNVASVFHFGETPDGQCFYAMEFIEGDTLSARVRRDGPLPVFQVVEIALQVSAALVAADERGLVHRDLKPANIMLTANARGRLMVKVIDFGLAKAAVTAAADTMADVPLTQIGGILGTPAYASPEQAGGHGVDARSDIYSLGVTLWYLLTGKVPFTGKSFDEIQDGQLHRPPPVAQLTDRNVPAPLVTLLTSMLSPKPAGRPASPAVLQELLEELREETATRLTHSPDGLPPSGKEGRTVPPGSPATRNSRLAPVLLWMGAALAVAGAAAYFYRARLVLIVPGISPSAGLGPANLAERDKSIAVLPLEDFTAGDATNTYFAAGIQDDLLSSLAKIKDLKVISRSSVMTYRPGLARNLREIGQALGVATLLEGSVRRAADRVLVNVALTDATTGRQIWAERYDRTMADALTLQGELATEIATALRATLSPEEKARVEIKPTESSDAYVLYLRAREYHARPTGVLQDYETAIGLYRQALGIDPAFALAHARLAAALAYVHVNFQPSAEIHEAARAEADQALRLQPELGEGVLARALCLYWTDKDYPAALREMEHAASLLPGNAEIDLFTGAIRRRQALWSEGLASMKRALVRDPRNAQVAREIMITDLMLRDWTGAAQDGKQALVLAPDNPTLKTELSWVGLWARNDLRPMRAALAALPEGFDPDGIMTYSRWDVALLARDFDEAERAVATSPVMGVVSTFGAILPRDYLLGCVHLARGDTAGAQPFFESARPGMEEQARAFPLDPFRQARLGILYAFMGRKAEALHLGLRAVEIMPESRDALYGASVAGLLAVIYAHTGETERAVTLIERLLRLPGPLSPHYDGSMVLASLRVRWQWDPLRNNPRFRALLAAPEPRTEYR